MYICSRKEQILLLCHACSSALTCHSTTTPITHLITSINAHQRPKPSSETPKMYPTFDGFSPLKTVMGRQGLDVQKQNVSISIVSLPRTCST